MREKGRQGDGDCNRFLGSSARCDNDRRTLHNIRAPSDYARPPAVRSDSSQLHKTQLTSYFVAGESEGRERRREEGGGERGAVERRLHNFYGRGRPRRRSSSTIMTRFGV